MKTKKRRNGFGFRLAQAIILFVGGIAFFLIFRIAALPDRFWATDYIDYLAKGDYLSSTNY